MLPLNMRVMESFVIGLSSQRMYRDLFWFLVLAAPLVLLVLLLLLAAPRFRRPAATALLFGAAGAALAGVVFHNTYAIAIWGGHDSAIRDLDQAAMQAGFAASVIAWAFGLAVYVATRRMIGAA